MAAAPETFDIAKFYVPSGWKKTQAQGLLTLKTLQETAQIFLFPSRRNESSAIREFELDWERLINAPLGSIPLPKVNTEQTPDGWMAVSGAAEVVQRNGQSKVLLLTSSGHGRTMSAVAHWVNDVHLPAIEKFFSQLEFHSNSSQRLGATSGVAPRKEADLTSPPPGSASSARLTLGPGSIKGNQPKGLFYRLEVGTGSGNRMEVKTLAFLAGSRIARVFPFGTGDVFDWTARCLPDTCGSYQLEASQLVIRWDNGRVDRLNFRTTAQGIELDGSIYKPAQPVSESSLVGAWRDAGAGGVSMSNAFRFARDGAFTFGSGTSALWGRFKVRELTIILTFADGTEQRRALFAGGTSQPIGLLCVDNEVYSRH